MRSLIALSLLAAGCLGAQQTTVVGAVVDQTGKPLAGVHVRVITGGLEGLGDTEAVYGFVSDSAGRFSIDGLKPGMYMVMAERSGYVQQAPKGIPRLVLKPGQHLDYKVAMAERAMVAGHVVDEYGDPVEGVMVQTEAAERSGDQSILFNRMWVSTDERGEFRIVAGPGKYYLKASLMGRPYNQPEIRTDGTNGGAFVTTYYPSAAGTAAASAIAVSAGQDLTGLEIHLLRAGTGAQARGFTVSGAVTGIPESGRAQVMLLFKEKGADFYNGRGNITAPDGTFKFTGMMPGHYSVQATYSTGKTPLQSRVHEFELEADETGLQLALAAPEELSGKLELVGDAAAGEAGKHTVRLESAEQGVMMGRSNPLAAEVAPDGSFRIAGVTTSKFKAVVEPMPENGYVKEVALDGKAVPGRVLDFTQGVGEARLKITVSRNGGRISGQVVDQDGQPAAGMMMIYCATDPKHLDEDQVQKTSDGKFTFKGIEPGKYRLVAVDLSDTMLFGGDDDHDETMQKIFDAGEEIEVKEGDRISKEIPLVTKLPGKKEEH